MYLAGSQPTESEASHIDALRASGHRVRSVNAQFFAGRIERDATIVTGSVPAEALKQAQADGSGIEVLPFSEEGGETTKPQKKLNKEELITALKEMGVEVPSGLKVDELRELHTQKSAELL